jgi:hypothetical protein
MDEKIVIFDYFCHLTTINRQVGFRTFNTHVITQGLPPIYFLNYTKKLKNIKNDKNPKIFLKMTGKNLL